MVSRGALSVSAAGIANGRFFGPFGLFSLYIGHILRDDTFNNAGLIIAKIIYSDNDDSDARTPPICVTARAAEINWQVVLQTCWNEYKDSWVYVCALITRDFLLKDTV